MLSSDCLLIFSFCRKYIYIHIYIRHFAENAGYFRYTSFEDVVFEAKGPITFYDSVTGKPLFVAPIGRSVEEFVTESEIHGWPSFRDEEVRLFLVVGQGRRRKSGVTNQHSHSFRFSFPLQLFRVGGLG